MTKPGKEHWGPPRFIGEQPAHCKCDRPMPTLDGCGKCGKPLMQMAQPTAKFDTLGRRITISGAGGR